ncbi:MAG: STAS domain-containing protein [SAR324 cluster bacterium]|nr:STAS domain-containing protein [SAR324 cluster bacterium]
MRIKHEINGNTCVVAIDGNIALEAVGEVKNYIKPFLQDEKTTAILVNFEKVDFIDSSGIGLIVSIYKSLQARQGKLLLSQLSKKNGEIFHMTRLDKILSIYPTNEDALNSL